MDETEIKHVLEAALLAAQKPLTLDRLVELFATKAPEVDKQIVRSGLESLSADYESRGLELKEVASGFRIQVRSRMSGWLQPLWEERPPRYSRALLETLALIAYRQPMTRGEIEEVRGVTVNANIIRTMLERNWIRVVGHRDVPGKPEMFGTTKEFLDYFGLRSIDQLPVLAEIREHGPESFPQTDFIEGLELGAAPPEAVDSPEVSNSPEAVDSPEVSNSPEAADSPEVSNSPEAADSPEVSDSREAADSPQASDSPESSLSPERREPHRELADSQAQPVEDTARESSESV
ncbi:MAG TPA: SMC-Scp complex subunit ScpB [Gammaproteobacteria bacterium]|nr:SMC-Scp complex subunit ScpB [Gammaproteobacteria bacterium]